MAVVKAAGIETEKHECRQRSSRFWRPHRSLMQFLQDHFPEEWHGEGDKVGVKRCRRRFMVLESQHRRGYFKVIPQACKRIPYCITCVDYKEWLRAKKRMNRFHCCTPGGEEPRFVPLNFVAPVDDDHQGVGMEACQDIGEFGKAVWETLLETYGDGIGAEMSYHDFGERGFAKRWPHMDITLNGWKLEDGQAVKTPRVELKGPGADRVRASYVRALRKRWHVSDEDRDCIYAEASPQFEEVRVGCRAYRTMMKYQVRQLVDLRKLEYDRQADKVWWCSYKENVREPFTVDEFIEGFHEYNERLSVWKKGRRNMLHRRYGHMSDRKRNETQQIVGGVPVPHGEDCTCGRCENWVRVYSTHVKPDTNVGTLDDQL